MGSTSSGWKGATAALPPARRGTAPSARSQACVTAIRAAGATTTIHVPGNGHTAAASWTTDCYDAGLPRRSTAEGWLDAGGEGSPLSDPLDRSVAEVPVYLDADGSGSTTAITTPPVGRDGLAIAMTEAAAHGYRLVVGEIGLLRREPARSRGLGAFRRLHRRLGSDLRRGRLVGGRQPRLVDDVGADGGGVDRRRLHLTRGANQEEPATPPVADN